MKSRLQNVTCGAVNLVSFQPNDIAIVRLRKAANISDKESVYPICLPWRDWTVQEAKKGIGGSEFQCL
jgi:hypothetical protein